MLKYFLPDNIACTECRKPVALDQLWPEERLQISHAVHRRRLEYSTVRWYARQALQQLGYAQAAVVNDAQGVPCWPAVIVGSITHCDSYYAAVLARQSDYRAIGVDAEPHKPLSPKILPLFSNRNERENLAQLVKNNPNICWDTLLFSIKESIFKAWFSLTRRWLDFRQVMVVIDAEKNLLRQLD